jgi:hypothetical protein
MLRPPAMFFLPNTTTLLARTAVNLLRNANQEVLDEAVQTLINRRLPANAVMAHLEQNVHVAEALEKLAKDWAPETLRVFASALQMEPSKTDVMDLIVAIAILNEPDLEAELRGENTTDPTASDLLENRRITWQYPPPGTPLTPPYVVLVAVEQIDTGPAESEVQAILGALVDYKGYKIARRLIGRPLPGRIRIPRDVLTKVNLADTLTQPTVSLPAAPEAAAPLAEAAAETRPSASDVPAAPSPTRTSALAGIARVSGGLAGASRLRGLM